MWKASAITPRRHFQIPFLEAAAVSLRTWKPSSESIMRWIAHKWVSAVWWKNTRHKARRPASNGSTTYHLTQVKPFTLSGPTPFPIKPQTMVSTLLIWWLLIVCSFNKHGLSINTLLGPGDLAVTNHTHRPSPPEPDSPAWKKVSEQLTTSVLWFQNKEQDALGACEQIRRLGVQNNLLGESHLRWGALRIHSFNQYFQLA